MKFTAAAIALITFLGAVDAKTMKTNQYKSGEDCQNDRGRINASGQDVRLADSTKVIFTTETHTGYSAHDGIHCTGESLGVFPEGTCAGVGRVKCLKLHVN
ncbi:hypothetical protein F4819DRAFT_293705 [Hypoxylon fuscum]|nr:hypothetical protein F4819DRAFT_293705 [Hypoxylon fuscum]